MPLEKPTAKDIFWKVLELDSTARESHLRDACQDDAELRARVDRLLGAQERSDSFLNPPILATTHSVEISARLGQRIGPYVLREQIGEGGFGAVFVAEQERPVARKVALKVIKPGMDSRAVVARFEAERQALALMDHPNISRVLDAGATEAGRPYFVMELVRGASLTDFCDAQKLGTRERLRLFIDVCRAVQHAHQKGIIHRDLKPSNVMVTMRDDRPIVKVIDFGVAKALSHRLTEKTVYTAYGQLLGTPLYMSPEQAQMNEIDVDTRSDIYSLGILLYELLTGMTPFDGEAIKQASFDELRRIIREDEPPRPSDRVSTLKAEQLSTVSDQRKVDVGTLARSLRGELDWVVMKALEKDRNRRYESASAFAADVERYLDDETVQACPPSMWYQMRKYARRNKAALTTSSLVALTLVIGSVVSAWLAVRAIAAEATLSQERQAAVKTAQQAQKNEQVAKRERDAAVVARDKLRRELYTSELNRAQSTWESGSHRRTMQILESTRPKPGDSDLRGFEWHYWNRRLHGPLETQVIDSPAGAKRIIDDTLSPDGSKLAVHYHEGHEISVATWDVAARKEICQFHLNWSSATDMGFSPDGSRLAILGSDRRDLEIRDVQTGKRVSRMVADGPVHGCLISRDGSRVVIAQSRHPARGRSRHGYKVWNLESDKITFSHNFGDDLTAKVRFLSPDANRIVVSSNQLSSPNSHLQILDVDTGTVLHERTFAGRVGCNAVSVDGTRLAVRVDSQRDQCLILDSQSLETLATLKARHSLTEVLFSPDGRLLAASTRASKAGLKRTARVLVWNLDDALGTGEAQMPLFTLPVPSPAEHLRFSGDGKQLRSLALGRIWAWSIPDELAVGESRRWSNEPILGGSFNSDGTRAVMRAEPSADFRQAFALLAWDVEADREIWRRPAVHDLAFAMPTLGPDSRYVVVPSHQRWRQVRDEKPGVFATQLHVIDGHTGREIRVFKPTGASNVDNLVFAPDGRHVAVLVTRRPQDDEMHWSEIRATFEAVLWNVVTGEEVFAVQIDDHAPNLCGFTADGKELMVGLQSSGGVLVLDADTGISRRSIAAQGTAVPESGKWSLSPDQKTLAMVGCQNHSQEITASLFAAQTGALLRRIPIDAQILPLGICWSPDSRRIALVSEQIMHDAVLNSRLAGEVTIWDVDTGRLLLTLNREGLATGHNEAIRFSPDGRRLLHIAADNRFEHGRGYSYLHPIHVWDGTLLPLTAKSR